MNMSKTGIYLITNKLNGKKYVGQSVDIEKRWKQHMIDSKKKDCAIYKAIRKYGIENLEFSILEECSVDKLDEREIYWISELDTYNNGYNMSLGGASGNNKGLNYNYKEYRNKYNKEHKEYINLKQKQYYQDHKEEKKQYNKQYHQEHKEYHNKKTKQYRDAHREEINAKRRVKRKVSKSAIINIQIEIPLW